MTDGQAVRAGIPWRLVGWGIAVAVILTPLVAMKLQVEGVNWTLSDFVFAGVLIAGTGLLYELAVWSSGKWSYRAAVALALATGFLTIWVNLAVGIVGNEDNPVNIVFLVVVALAIAGSIVARGKAEPMARAMTVAAAAQAFVGAVVLVYGIGAMEPPPPIMLFALIEIFAAMWLGSALLFRKAGGESR
jgi:hypothetical protein